MAHRAFQVTSVAMIGCMFVAVTNGSIAEDKPLTREEIRQRVKATPGAKNLHNLAYVFHNYHDIFTQLPRSVVLGPDGKTPHSWRVEILPLVKYSLEDPGPGKRKDFPAGNREAYNALIRDCGYDLDQPWDSPANAKILNDMPAVFRHPDDDAGSNQSAFYAIVGPETAISPDPISLSAIKEPGSVLMIAESRSREPWTKPVDVFYFESATVPRLGGFTKDGFLGVTCDGAVHFIPDKTPPDSLRALMTRQNDDTFQIPGIPWQPNK